jgi:hypothetical protein
MGPPQPVRYVVVCSLSHSAAGHSLAVTRGSFIISAHWKLSVVLVKSRCKVYLSRAFLLAKAVGQYVLTVADKPFLDSAFFFNLIPCSLVRLL